MLVWLWHCWRQWKSFEIYQGISDVSDTADAAIMYEKIPKFQRCLIHWVTISGVSDTTGTCAQQKKNRVCWCHRCQSMFACVDRWGEKGIFGAGQGAERGWKIVQLILGMGPAQAEVRILVQRASAPSKRALLIVYYTCIKYCVCAIFYHVSKYILSSAG
jgi:hypothetical protein